MRTLKFIVDGQNLKKNPHCDFEGIVPGTEGYLTAEFSFSSEWDDTMRVVEFTRNGRECEPQILFDGKTCIIPSEALTSRSFKLRVLGKKEGYKLTTDKVEVIQNGGKL